MLLRRTSGETFISACMVLYFNLREKVSNLMEESIINSLGSPGTKNLGT